MRVLITSRYNSSNYYVRDLIDFLLREDNIEIVSEPTNFWVSNIKYDIIHIQWPEELFNWNLVTASDIEKVNNRLTQLKDCGSKIISTLHNAIPHKNGKYEEILYESIYRKSDAIINLGKNSSQLYPENNNFIIPHSNYALHYNIKSHKNNIHTFISFGKIRNNIEEKQIIDAFLAADIPKSKLIITNSLIGKNPYFTRKKDYLKMLKYNFFLKSLRKKKIFLIPNRLSDQKIEELFNNADTVIIPRIDQLNSGVVFMGFTFGKTVIGPAIGNIKEFLEINNNPMFIPNDIVSISASMKKALTTVEKGSLNKDFSEKYLNPEDIAHQHFLLYKKLIND